MITLLCLLSCSAISATEAGAVALDPHGSDRNHHHLHKNGTAEVEQARAVAVGKKQQEAGGGGDAGGDPRVLKGRANEQEAHGGDTAGGGEHREIEHAMRVFERRARRGVRGLGGRELGRSENCCSSYDGPSTFAEHFRAL